MEKLQTLLFTEITIFTLQTGYNGRKWLLKHRNSQTRSILGSKALILVGCNDPPGFWPLHKQKQHLHRRPHVSAHTHTRPCPTWMIYFDTREDRSFGSVCCIFSKMSFARPFCLCWWYSKSRCVHGAARTFWGSNTGVKVVSGALQPRAWWLSSYWTDLFILSSLFLNKCSLTGCGSCVQEIIFHFLHLSFKSITRIDVSVLVIYAQTSLLSNNFRYTKLLFSPLNGSLNLWNVNGHFKSI